MSKKSNAEILSDLHAARDNLIDAMVTNQGVHELEVRGRRVVRKDFEEELMSIERLISFYEDRAAGKQVGHVRTVAKIKYR